MLTFNRKMGKSIQMSGTVGTSNQLTAGSVNYILLIGGINTSIILASSKVRYYSGGILTNYALMVTSNNDTSNITVTLKKNAGTSGNQSISITASTTGLFEDTGNTDTVAAGDDWYAETSTVTAAKVVQITFSSIIFDASSNTVSKPGNFTGSAGGLVSNPTASSTTYVRLGPSTLIASEASTQYKVLSSVTGKKLYVYVTTNTRSSTTTVGSRKNTSNGAMSVSIPTVTTGVFEDTSNTDSLVFNDLYNCYLTAGVL